MEFAFQCRYCLVRPADGVTIMVGNQGTGITPQCIEVRIHWVGPNTVHYLVKGDPKMRETSLDRFLDINYAPIEGRAGQTKLGLKASNISI